MNNLKEKNCYNCRYCLIHYVRTANGYISTHDGHCVCKELNDKRIKNKFALKDKCEYWQPIEIQIAERRQKIKLKLAQMAKKLEAICEVLIDDND